MCLDKLQTLMSSPLFNGLNEEEVSRFLALAETRRYKKGDVIFLRTEFIHAVGIVTSGSVRVSKDTDDKAYIVNTIHSGGMLGVSSVFSHRSVYSTALTADSDCEIVFFCEELIKNMCEKDIRITENYIRFLTDRILFLNDKIRSLTARSAEETFAAHLLSAQADGVCRFNSFSLLARKLDIGRASLYRAMDSLERDGVITKNGKDIIINDINKLKKYTH